MRCITVPFRLAQELKEVSDTSAVLIPALRRRLDRGGIPWEGCFAHNILLQQVDE